MRGEFPHEAKKRKHAESEERNTAWRSLSPQQQLDSLNERLGINVGAKKQRKSILKGIK